MEEAKKKIHLELEMTNDEAVEFFKNLTSLEERWKSKNNTKEGPLSLEDSLDSYIHNDYKGMVEVVEFAEDNYLFCHNLFASLEEVKTRFHLEQEEYERFKTWFLKISCSILNEIKQDKDSGTLNLQDLPSGFQMKKEELKFAKKSFEDGERDFKKDLLSEQAREQDERLKELLKEKNWSIVDVAREMSLSTRSIYRRMSKLGLKKQK